MGKENMCGRMGANICAALTNIENLHFCKQRIVKWGHAVAQLVEALRYKPEGRGFDSRWCHWNFSLTQYFRSRYGPGVD